MIASSQQFTRTFIEYLGSPATELVTLSIANNNDVIITQWERATVSPLLDLLFLPTSHLVQERVECSASRVHWTFS